MRELIQSLAARPDVSILLADWQENYTQVLNEALAIQSIPAPTFHEQARAAHVQKKLNALLLPDVAQDDAGNVHACTPGANRDRPALLISAHLDTVFPPETNLTVRHDETAKIIYGPGLGDNSLGVAALLGLAQKFHDLKIVPATDIHWLATTGEEGLGNLRGMRRAYEKLSNRLGLGIIIEGMGLGRIYHAGLGVRRLRVSVMGPGGHSWLHAGQPSAVHHLLRLGAALVDEIRPPVDPRSSFNVGLISGGTSINSLAAEASLATDLRSVDAATLTSLEDQMVAVVNRFSNISALEVSTAIIGDRPSARLPLQHPLVRTAQGVLEHLGYERISLEIGSTDANIPLAAGMPAVCIGITGGGNAHTINEFIETAPIAIGMQQLTLLALLAAEYAATWSAWDCIGE